MFRALIVLLMLFGTHLVAAANPPDVAENEVACSQIAALVSDSEALSLPARVERALLLSLRGATDAIHQGERENALTLLKTFTYEVRSVKRAKRIPADAADPLIAKAEWLIATLRVPGTQ